MAGLTIRGIGMGCPGTADGACNMRYSRYSPPSGERHEETPARMTPKSQFDISSKEDFPSLSSEAPVKSRQGSRQKRRIRPTPLTNAEKPEEGDITILGLGTTSFLDKLDDADSRFRPMDKRHGLLCKGTGFSPEGMSSDSKTTSRIGIEDAKAHERKNGPTSAHGSLETAVSGVGVLEEHESEDLRVTNFREVACGPGHHGIGRRAKGSYLGREFGDVASSERTQDGPVGSSVKSNHHVPPATRAVEVRRPELHDTAAPRHRCTMPSCGANSSSSHTPKAHRGKLLRASEVPVSWRDGLSPIPDPPRQITLSTSTDKKERGEKERNGKEREQMERDSRNVEGNRAHGCNALGKPISWREAPGLAGLASLYVHVILCRLVPSLATEIHLAIRLLHVHPSSGRDVDPHNLARECFRGQRTGNDAFVTHPSTVGRPSNSACDSEVVPFKCLFQTGLDCRAFAARVFIGLKPLLPHIGADILDLLEQSPALISESETLVAELHHELRQVRGKYQGASGSQGSGAQQPRVEDTVIVQNVGAPFAVLQWREADSIMNFRTNAERALYQNRQETVDRFGTLLRNYQASKKGLQQNPECSLQDIRTSAFAVIKGLAPANFEWLARYFLAQLMGWGISAPEETDSEVVALVASAGDKGRATLQKLHRRISTSSTGEGEIFSKSSQKLSHPPSRPPGEENRDAKGSKGIKGASAVESLHSSTVHQSKARGRNSGGGSRVDEGQVLSAYARVPTAPLRLQWFPGNQEFFYHVLLTLDSHTFNSHVKTAIAEEIARLYDIPSTEDAKAAKQDTTQGRSHLGSHDGARSRDGFEGFTERLVKLKVLAKFLGLLTFAPNWGVTRLSVKANHRDFSWLQQEDQEQGLCLPLPLEQYLAHAWSSQRLVGVVPWIADFLRMMKWDPVSIQAPSTASPCVHFFATLVLDTSTQLPAGRAEQGILRYFAHAAFTTSIYVMQV